jgi:hypothetical protein
MFLAMKIIVQVDDKILEETKELAKKTGRSVDAVISDALEQMLLRQRLIQSRSTIQLPAMDLRAMRDAKNFDPEKK